LGLKWTRQKPEIDVLATRDYFAVFSPAQAGELAGEVV
jgi:hypothetical protein